MFSKRKKSEVYLKLTGNLASYLFQSGLDKKVLGLFHRLQRYISRPKCSIIVKSVTLLLFGLLHIQSYTFKDKIKTYPYRVLTEGCYVLKRTCKKYAPNVFQCERCTIQLYIGLLCYRIIFITITQDCVNHAAVCEI